MNKINRPDLLAVDGGGSGCRVALVWQGIRLEATGGPANVFTDPEAGAAAIDEALIHIASKAGIRRRDLSALPAYLGVAGVMTHAQGVALAQRLRLPGAVIEDDRRAGVTGALGASDGVVAMLGTGSFFARVTGEGMTVIGGWGHRFSDEGSGAWIGARLLRAAFRAADGRGPDSPLVAEFLDAHGGALGLLRSHATAGAERLAALAPAVFDAPEDPVARVILEAAVTTVKSALADLGWDGADPVCLAGGIGPRLAPHFGAPLRPPEGSALDGALRLAERLAQERGA